MNEAVARYGSKWPPKRQNGTKSGTLNLLKPGRPK